MFGVLNFSVLSYILLAFLFTQFTIAAVTLYLHRCQAHRAIDLHPVVSHVFRLWLWLTTGMLTSEWVAVHRKHHANTDIEGDPHSPKVYGIRKVFFEGAELYRSASRDKLMVKKYSHGTPEDWVEKNVYERFPRLGVALMLFADVFLFGLPGISIWGVQMLWIPVHAAGVINGIGHHWGYRNFETPDVSRNIIPFAFWIGGEELHNNHHAFASSAKFSINWWEFDIGWLYIRFLSFLGLAKVNKLPPKLAYDANKSYIDIDTVKAVVNNRFGVMADYYKKVICPAIRSEQSSHSEGEVLAMLRTARSLMHRSDKAMTTSGAQKLQIILNKFERLKIVYQFSKNLQNIWLVTAKSQKEIVEALQQWCKQAETSGLEALEQFSLHMKQYVLR